MAGFIDLLADILIGGPEKKTLNIFMFFDGDEMMMDLNGQLKPETVYILGIFLAAHIKDIYLHKAYAVKAGL